MNRKLLIVTATIALAVVGSVGAALLLGPSNIDPVNKYTWSENAGWMNWADANGGSDGVVINPDHLSGSIWMENAGWVNVGNGGGPYANTNDTNFGVNILPGGDLNGYAWGENIGWINFDTGSQAPNQARFEGASERFRGYVWGENIGWINLDDATHYVALTSLPALIPDAPGNDKVRYISFQVPPANTAAVQTAIQVKLVSLMHPNPPNLPQFPAPDFHLQENTVRYVAAPGNCQETELPLTTFKCATLQCAPVYVDWEAALAGATLHVTGQAVVPSSIYELRQLAASCQGNEGSCAMISAPLMIATARWGDVAAAFQAPSPAPLTQPNITDVAACVDKFKGVPTAIIVARADVNPAVPNERVDIADVANIVDAFKNLAYPFPGPVACP